MALEDILRPHRWALYQATGDPLIEQERERFERYEEMYELGVPLSTSEMREYRHYFVLDRQFKHRNP